MHPVPGKKKSQMLCEAFMAGAPASAPGHVFAGVKLGNVSEWRRVREKGSDFYYVDGSYFDQTRDTMFRVTKNALQFTEGGESDGRRWAALGIELQPWNRWPDGHMVYVEQSPDHMLYTLGNGAGMPGVPPRGYGNGERRWRLWSPNKPKIQTTLADDLHGAAVLVTHTSAAAVMAIIAGVPVITAPECAAFDVGAHDRIIRLRLLADHQFTLDEMKDGTAWRKLNP